MLISVFLDWETATVDDGFGVSATATAGLTGVGRFVGVLAAIGVVALTAPAFVRVTISRRRAIGLMVVLATLTALAGVWTTNAGKSLAGASQRTPGVGVFVCWLAIALMWVGAVRLVRQRRGTTRSAYTTR